MIEFSSERCGKLKQQLLYGFTFFYFPIVYVSDFPGLTGNDLASTSISAVSMESTTLRVTHTE